MKEKFPKMIIVIGIFIVLFIIPVITEYILFNFKIPFNISSKFSEDIWFNFIASYLGTIGTIMLSIIALYQNKKYKELSDESEKKFLELQAEIKELNKKNVELIEINTKIEKAKYYPQLSDLGYYYWNISGNQFDKILDINNKFQITIKQEGEVDIDRKVSEIYNDYNSLTFILKNEGEKSIRNFNCNGVRINKQHTMGFWTYTACDIKPGESIYVLYATKEDLQEKVKNDEIKQIDFEYTMENVLGESFSMNINIFFYDIEENIVKFDLTRTKIKKELS